MNSDKIITLVIPNKETYIGGRIICPKEVVQQGYISRIGKDIDFNGELRKVIEVNITEDNISVKLEAINNEYTDTLNAYGTYVTDFAKAHNISIKEAINESMCKARWQTFSMTGK